MAGRVNAKGVQAESLITLSLPNMVSTENKEGLLREAIDIAREETLLSTEARARLNLSILLFYDVGNLRAAKEEQIKAVEIHRKRGDLNGELSFLFSLVWILSVMGDLSEAEKVLEQIDQLDESLDHETTSLRGERLWGGSMYLYARGNISEAVNGYRSLMSQPRNPYSDTDVFWAAQELGFGLIALGQLEEAEYVLLDVLEIADRGMIWQPTLIRAQLSMVFTKQGKHDQSQLMLEGAIDSKPPGRMKWPNLIIDWAQSCALAAEGNWDAAFQLFEGTVKEMQSAEVRLFEMEVMRDWADAYLARNESGDTELARELLNGALAAYLEMGADGWVGHVESRLAEFES